MPLPLYGSGGRSSRILAAISPTRSLSAEVRVRRFFSTLALTILGSLKTIGWRVAQRERHRVARHLGAIADAIDLKLARPALSHAFDHVGEVRADQAVARPVLARIIRPRHNKLVAFQLDADALRESLGQFTFRPLDQRIGQVFG